jgi:hypothetical protein
VNLLERLAKYEQDNEPRADKIVKGYILAGRIRRVFNRCSNLLTGFYLPVEMLLLLLMGEMTPVTSISYSVVNRTTLQGLQINKRQNIIK